jgi:hypothetical protein
MFSFARVTFSGYQVKILTESIALCFRLHVSRFAWLEVYINPYSKTHKSALIILWLSTTDLS